MNIGVEMASEQECDEEEIERLRELKIVCFDNLLASSEVRIYFKDLESRFLLVSEGCNATAPTGRTVEDLIGKTDFDFYSDEHAQEAFDDEQEVIRSGTPIVGKLERETFVDRVDNWVATSKMPLRDASGAIIGTFGVTRDVTAQILAEEKLAYQVLHDPVTGLANRIALMDRLQQALVAMERMPGRIAVIFADLDHFKDVNDTYGHDVGDQILIEVGRQLSRASRRVDTVARLGGDEFVVLCTSLHDGDDVANIAERIVQGVRASHVRGVDRLSATCSVGFAVCSDPQAVPEDLIRQADEAMYEAKAAGRDRYRIYDSSHHLTSRSNLLRSELLRAVENREFFLLYQPLFSLEKKSLVGVEALVRWQHPERGVVAPNEFIPFAEQHGVISQIDEFVLNEACRQLSEWAHRSDWPRDFTIAVNVSGRELSEPGYLQLVTDTIIRYSLQPRQLCLEITESVFISEWSGIHETATALSALGVRLAIDGFGTGYSSLAHLQRTQIDVVKIDRSLVEQLGRSQRDRDMVTAVTAMSHALGMSVVGEGVETDLQLDLLTGLDCDQGQGFMLARPMTAGAVEALVK